MDRANRFCGVPLGSSHCASSISLWCSLGNAYPVFRTALAAGFVRRGVSVTINDVLYGRYTPKRGDVIHFTRHGGGHVALNLVYNSRTQSFSTFEANTSSGQSGSQHNGGGDFRRTRRIRDYPPSSAFRMDWITPLKHRI